MAGSDGRSSAFAVVGNGPVFIVLFVRHRPLSSSFSNVVHLSSSLLVGGVCRLQAVVAVFDRAWSWSSAFADARRRSWVAGVGAPCHWSACLGCGLSFCSHLGVCHS